ncbi:MAG: hypothetical protein DWQ08_13705 [Proteobacteria bacterium]|nr:MAG: hypothetical protein DWQ08_13705 [Pseudomonadota bacterium]
MTTDLSRAAAATTWYAAVIFLSSACLLILEIVASRLLAPYVGVSLYTWTAIIGVILAGLSLGNWLGGLWADRGAGTAAAGWTLVASGTVTLAVPTLLVHLAEFLQAQTLSLVSASLAYVSALFFVPALVLGVITPLLTTLALSINRHPGRVVGAMHALAALGSICGTFAAGFWLVPWFGTRNIIAATGVFLAFLGLVFLVRRPRAAMGAVALCAAAILALASGGGLRNPCDTESLYYCIRVVDEPTDYGPSRTLVLDHMVHSNNHASDPELLILPYAQAMHELLMRRLRVNDSKSPRVFFAGGGAYTQPRALAHLLPMAHIEVAELDAAVTATARNDLYVDMENFIVHDADARIQLPRAPRNDFDAIVTDVFHDVAVPYHLTTVEFVDVVESRLKPDGVYLLNIIDVFPDSRLVKAIVKTLRTRFANIQVWLERPPQNAGRLTYIVSATNAAPYAPVLMAQTGLERTWYDLTEPVESIGTGVGDIPVLTDDYAPVERLVSTLFWTEMGL